MKKLLALTTSLLLTAGLLAGCGSSDDSSSSSADTSKADETTAAPVDKGPFDLKVWGAQEDQEMLKKLVDNFKKANPEVTYNITFGVVSEADAKTEVLKDPSVAADVFAFASDQIAELQSAGALYRVSKNKDEIVKNNSEASITASTVDGELYAYPSSSDTYFMYYDKKYYTEDDVKSLETMMAKDLGSGVTNFSMDIDNGWYNASFFYTAGSELFGANGLDDKQCTFNDKNGLLAGNYMLDLVKNKKFANHDDGKLKTAFQARTLGATVTGTWNASDIEASLGSDFAATKLPTIKIDGKDVQLSSMANFKLYGVNSATKSPAAAMALAEFLTNEESQKIRFEERSFAPTNVKLSNDSAALASNPAVSALANQAQFATLQPSIPQMGNFWAPSEAFGKGLEDGSITKDNMQSKLNDLVTAILSKLAE